MTPFPIALVGAPKTYTADASTGATEVALPDQAAGAAQLVLTNLGAAIAYVSLGLTGGAVDVVVTGADRNLALLPGTSQTISGGLGYTAAKIRAASSSDVQFHRAIGA